MKPFPTGIGSHYLSLLSSYISRFPDKEYIIIFNDRGEKIVKESFAKLQVRYVRVNINGGSLKQYFLFWYLAIIYRKLKPDLLLTDIWSSFPFMPKYLLIIYDLIGFHNIAKTSFKQKLYDKVFYPYMARFAVGLIASTKSVKDDIETYFHIPSKRIHIITPSVSQEYIAPLDETYIQSIIEKYQLPSQYIVYVGNRRPHKNLETAFQVLQKILPKYPSLYLVLIGGYDTEKVKNSVDIDTLLSQHYTNIAKHVLVLGRVQQNSEVKAILNKSVALICPSRFEGVGLTPLEASFSGTCVIASNISAIREVMDNGAMFADPRDADTFANHLERILEHFEVREEYIYKGLKAASRFSWESAAIKLHEVITSCI